MAETEFEAGASCPLHPAFQAVGTCTRCGNFMCRTCSQGGSQAWCPACLEREGMGRSFPLNRENWSVGGLLELSWEAFKREWVMLSVGVLIFMAASFVGQVFSQILSLIGGLVDNVAVLVVAFLIGTLGSYVIQGAVTLGFLRMSMDVLNGQRADLARMFSQFGKVPAYLGTLVLSILLVTPLLVLIVAGSVGAGLATGSVSWSELVAILDLPEAELGGAIAGLLPTFTVMGVTALALYCFPGAWLLTPLVLLQPELARTDSPRVVETLRRCFAYAKGERLPIVGVLLLGGLFMCVGFLLCCLPVVPALGLFQLMLAGLYLALSNSAETR
ncbi:Membrane glycoprotein [Myxococcus hansupus]|uniref:Membrane glycoprotein n=1 Tax=Pseudomyxococcus hansupus TaxID=1297742 RepID=A0A0H4X3H7_9BACT|nr:hypothetical protein [Myxococcus hansupus]AKQ69739.1 Membrane glycoprotein [Myxococcus hansupus]